MLRRIMLVFSILVASMLVQAEPLLVQTAPLEEKAFYPTYKSSARIFSEYSATLRSEVMSPLVSLPVQVGQAIKAGEVLARFQCQKETFDQEIFAAKLKITHAQLSFASWQSKQNEALSDKALSSLEKKKHLETEVLRFGQELKITQRELDRALNRLAKCEIKAPFAGVVTARHASRGDLLNPGEPLLSLVDPMQRYGLATIRPEQWKSLAEGRNLRFVDRLGEDTIELGALVPRIDEKTGLQTVRFSLSDKATSLVGSRGHIYWEDKQPHLPARYIRQRGEHFGYFLLENNKALFITVLDYTPGQSAPLFSRRVKLITSHLDQLIDGQVVSADVD